MSSGLVGYTRRGPLAVIRLERPAALNAITYPMIADVERFARQAEQDPDVFAICITGEGRGFCAGIDLGVLTEHTQGGDPASSQANASRPARPALFSFLLDISKPVIAAVNGVTAGGGFVLAMMCDLRFMAEGASLITVFARRGLIAEHATSFLLPRMIGINRALDLLWSSRPVDAAEGYRLGFVDRVAAPDDLLASVEDYVAKMAATVAPHALAVMKAQVHRQLAMSFEEASADCDREMRAALVHPDAAEGARSFIERRAPRFTAWPPAGGPAPVDTGE